MLLREYEISAGAQLRTDLPDKAAKVLEIMDGREERMMSYCSSRKERSLMSPRMNSGPGCPVGLG